jgi:arylsulfatase A-like enzyme
MAALCLAAACDAGAPARPPRDGPVNVLLISLDSTRRDLVSAYGERPRHAPELVTSPNLDRLAAEGALLLDAYGTASWTLSAHVSMMTGQSSLEHLVDDARHAYTGARPMLAEVLLAHGYRTAGFFSGPFLEPQFGFDRGFERYEACYGEDLAAAAQAATPVIDDSDGDAQVDVALGAILTASYRDVSSRVVTDRALGELDAMAADGRPFFLFAHYFDPHYDYIPPAEHDRFDPDYAGDLDGRDFLKSPAIAGPRHAFLDRERRISGRDLEHVRALYEAELAWTDAQVGRLLDRLDALGLAGDTLVVVTADHGDEFFEHGSIGHRRTLFEEIVAVPMVVRLPGDVPAGVRVRGLVSHDDLLPTVLDLARLPPLASLASTSFAPLLMGEDDGAERSVLGRVVVHYPWEETPALMYADGAGLAYYVEETFRKGALKLRRRRVWSAPLPRVQRRTEGWEAQRDALRAREELTWIDVERFPHEPGGERSSDFDDPRARAALEAFRARYTDLQARAGALGVGAQDERITAMLTGLGYVDDGDDGDDGDGGSSGRAARLDDLTLPPPELPPRGR